jgi:hypothetical protein
MYNGNIEDGSAKKNLISTALSTRCDMTKAANHYGQ